MSRAAQTNRLLGHPPDARLLIVNADDFGMCHSINQATIRAIREGVASSCTLMLPCPWSLHGIDLLKDNPDIPFGVHLTVVCEHARYKWRPVTWSESVASLRDESGYYCSYGRIDEFVEEAKLAELEVEFRGQIETVLQKGLRPTHLDSHCHVHTRREAIFDMVVDLAREYGLAVRANTRPLIEKLQEQGYPANGHDVLDSYRLETKDKPSVYHKLLRALPAGLTEWAVHPGIKSAELQAMEPTWEVRQADFNFLVSQEAREIIEQEEIVVLNYEPLQKAWQEQS